MSEDFRLDPQEKRFAARRRGPRLWPWLLAVTVAAALAVGIALLWPRWRSGDGADAAEAASGEATSAAAPARRPRRPPPAATLAVGGAREFEGYARAACTPHERTGLQVALRTGAPDLPVVALVLEEFDGPGSYTGRLFLTGRGGRGALLRSTGVVEVAIERRTGRGPRAVLAGAFEGDYAGAAGRGTVSGRFGRCLFAAPAAAASPSP